MIGGHLGNRVSDLLDGQLERDEEDRAWQHVHACHYCRDLVEREGWVKTRLAGLSLGGTPASDRLKDALMGAQAGLTPGDALLALQHQAPPRQPRRHRRRRGRRRRARRAGARCRARERSGDRPPGPRDQRPAARRGHLHAAPERRPDGQPPRPLRPRLPVFVKIGQ